jgi:hypothetical protein
MTPTPTPIPNIPWTRWMIHVRAIPVIVVIVIVAIAVRNTST